MISNKSEDERFTEMVKYLLTLGVNSRDEFVAILKKALRVAEGLGAVISLEYRRWYLDGLTKKYDELHPLNKI